MGLLDILGAGSPQRSGMSPLMLGLMGVLAYRTFKGKGRLADILGMNGASAETAGSEGPLGGLSGLLTGGAAGGILSSGISDMLNRFRENGHGDTAHSWISDGPNKGISPDNLEQALGAERVNWLIEQTGLSKDALLKGLSGQLPEAIDKLTPHGRLPTDEEISRTIGQR